MLFKTVPEDIKFESAEWLQKMVDEEILEQDLKMSVEVEVVDDGSMMIWCEDGTFIMFSYDPTHRCIQPTIEYETLDKRILTSSIIIDANNIFHPLLKNIHDAME